MVAEHLVRSAALGAYAILIFYLIKASMKTK